METKAALAALSALAQETRLYVFRTIIEAGAEGMTVGSIGERASVPLPTLSFHLKELTRAGLIEPRPAGRFIHYSASFARMDELIRFLTDNCCHGKPESCLPCRTNLDGDGPRRQTKRARARGGRFAAGRGSDRLSANGGRKR